jgi:hypothetical protein
MSSQHAKKAELHGVPAVSCTHFYLFSCISMTHNWAWFSFQTSNWADLLFIIWRHVYPPLPNKPQAMLSSRTQWLTAPEVMTHEHFHEHETSQRCHGWVERAQQIPSDQRGSSCAQDVCLASMPSLHLRRDAKDQRAPFFKSVPNWVNLYRVPAVYLSC